MSSMKCSVINRAFCHILISPLSSCLHKPIHKLKLSFLSIYVEFVNEYGFHNSMIKHLPVILKSASLFSTDQSRISRRSI